MEASLYTRQRIRGSKYKLSIANNPKHNSRGCTATVFFAIIPFATIAIASYSFVSVSAFSIIPLRHPTSNCDKSYRCSREQTSSPRYQASLKLSQSEIPSSPTLPSQQNEQGKDNERNEVIAQCDSFGGDIKRIKMEGEDNDFLAAMSVPTFAAFHPSTTNTRRKDTGFSTSPKRLGLEGIIPGAFLLENALSTQECNDMIRVCEHVLKFGHFQAGKNHHGAMQIIVTEGIADKITNTLSPFVDLSVASSSSSPENIQDDSNVGEEYNIVGVNRRWRVYRYEPGGKEKFAPHIDAGFPPSTLSNDGTTLIWDATRKSEGEDKENENKTATNSYTEDTVSRMTVLIYLNDDFLGGETKFYAPLASSGDHIIGQQQRDEGHTLIASIRPKTGSILVFPQAVGEEAVEHARSYWPLHEGSPVLSGTRPKYVIRSDILFCKSRSGQAKEEEKQDPLWRFDDDVRKTFLPKSSALDKLFLNHIANLYNPHMGVENAGPLLYSFVRFTKVRKIVEIGAGYTTLWLLRALKDNDDEMKNIKYLQDEGKCRLLDYPWSIPKVVNKYCSGNSEEVETNDNKRAARIQESSSLLCIDNCLHQRETATGAGAVARTLGLGDYLQFVKGDAFDMQFEPESIDLLWCDFGVGSRMKDFASNAWKSIRPGGFLICHSTLTNSRTRDWLESVRNRESEELTGIPIGEYSELSLLEPQKRYQNSISVLQKRRGTEGDFEEPLYSEYA